MAQVSLCLVSLLDNNLKLYNMFVTPRLAKKVITNLDLSKVSGPDCIPVVALQNGEPGLS